MILIDPPSGWRYGFPKEYNNPDNIPLQEWLLQNGYPQYEIDTGRRAFSVIYIVPGLSHGAKYTRFIGDIAAHLDVCPFGCIFSSDKKLIGDCRMPESGECYFNNKDE
jgi:hypothetical protein